MYSAYYKQLNAFFVSSYGHDNSDIAGYVNFVGSISTVMIYEFTKKA